MQLLTSHVIESGDVGVHGITVASGGGDRVDLGASNKLIFELIDGCIHWNSQFTDNVISLLFAAVCLCILHLCSKEGTCMNISYGILLS